MTEPLHSVSVLIFLIGLLVAASVSLRIALERTWVPPLLAFMALGFLLRLADHRWDLLSADAEFVFDVLAELGIIALLFRVGLESDLAGLWRQLPTASLIWVGNVAASAVLGYIAMAYVLGFGFVPSLVAATALTATSIGVSVGLWGEHDAIKTPKGELLTDVAEMDDLSGITLMAVLFAVLPILAGGSGEGSGAGTTSPEASLTSELWAATGILIAKFALFASACFLFSRYGEEHLRAFFERYASPPELVVLVAGIGIIIAGTAGWLGFSAAIGALFAGLAFSRDPEAVKVDAGFGGIYHLLVPFFFIGIGLSLDPGALTGALVAGAVLTAVAIVGKVVGAGLPALASTGVAGAALIGVSMVPRAEITMIIMERGRQLGDWAVPAELYAAFVIVSAATCLFTPLTLAILFRRYSDAIRPAANKAAPDR